MIVERVTNQIIINTVMSHPENVKAIHHDYSGFAEWPIMPNIYYLAVFTDSDIAGLFIGIKKSEVVADCHLAMLPEYRKYTDQAFQLCLKWAKENTDFRKLVGETPIYNKAAIDCNIRNGMIQEGINKKSIMKNGKLHDQVYFGLEI